MKDRDFMTRDVVRSIEAAIGYAEKKSKLSEIDILQIINREHKKRVEAIDAAKKGRRDELAQNEKKERDIIEEILPKGPTQEEIEKEIKEVISTHNPPYEIGRIIGQVIHNFKGKANGGIIANEVNRILNG